MAHKSSPGTFPAAKLTFFQLIDNGDCCTSGIIEASGEICEHTQFCHVPYTMIAISKSDGSPIYKLQGDKLHNNYLHFYVNTMISIVYGSPVAGWPNNWAATSADLANDAPNICELALPTIHPPPSTFHINGLGRSNCFAPIVMQ
jgi:hypothetical protein